MSLSKKETGERFDLLADIGCIVCCRPAEIHHLKGIEFGCGIGLRAPDEFTIPLCTNHHRGKEGFHSIGKKTWESRYGSQRELLEKTNKILSEIIS